MSEHPAEVSGRAAAFTKLRTGFGLLVVWLLLWQSLEPLVMLGGVLVAAGVTYVARLPAMAGRLRVRPLRLAHAFGVFWADLVVSSVTVGWRALWRPRSMTAAIIEVPMLSRSEAVLAVVAADLTLRPGSLVLDFGPSASVFYVHGLPVANGDDLEELRAAVVATERRVVCAIGPPDDVERAQRHPEHQEGT